MDTPMIELLDTVILSGPVKMALLDQYGEHGEIYRQVLLYESHQWDKLPLTDIDPNDYSNAYIESVLWADTTIKSLNL